MTNKNKLLTMLILSSSAVAATALINKCIKISATSKNILEEPDSFCYRWRFGNIHYTKSGSGKPLLLIHDLDAASSGYEWNQVVSSLSKEYTVYTMDLLGCGRSEKPCLTYTNYLYVQLIADFVKSEIGHRTDVIATGHSSALAIMACNNNPELFDKLLLINPDSILTCSQIPGKYAKLYKGFLDLPVIGTLLYHIATSKQAIRESFITQYFYNPYSVRESYVNSYYEAAHLNLSPKSVYASVHCNYTKANIVNAIKKIDNSIYIIGGAGMDNIKDLLNEYTIYNPAIEYTLLPDTKYLPQLEKPAEFVSTVKMFFS
ncbi:MAG: alpha/beta hydrolase [Anaerovoracaceae bacterium]